MSRINKLLAQERLYIAEVLAQAQAFPGSFRDSDIDRLKSCLADPAIAANIGNGDVVAINNYQALCISADTVPFIDVDTSDRHTLNWLQSDLGNAGLGGRVYRTRKGYRLALHQEMHPETLFSRYLPKSKLDHYGIDPTYALFCTELGNYRARCSAKPWRIARKNYDTISNYERYRYPIVQFLSSFGSAGEPSEHWQRVMAMHDAASHAVTDNHNLY
ncbi:MAG: hypothetical protein F6K19_35050 [Cyanothece sp. SIO1E1]|nr:hypothetical protein [Cyanothece sp. SIO1E1]